MEACDEANAYVADSAPWAIAKQTDVAGNSERLHAVCTTALNLFRLIAAYLKPVLPNLATQAEAFLAAPVSHWSDLDAPLLGHAIQSYTPLFTRIDPKQIDAMTEASKESLQPAAPTTPVKKAETATPKAAEPAKTDASASTHILSLIHI